MDNEYRGTIRMASKPVKANPEEFLERLNKDTRFRNKFLDHPAKTLKENGFDLTSEEERRVEAIIGYLKVDVKHLFEIPAGYTKELEKLGFGIKIPLRLEAHWPSEKIIPI